MNPSRIPRAPVSDGLALIFASIGPLAAVVYLVAIFDSGLVEILGLMAVFVGPAWLAVWMRPVPKSDIDTTADDESGRARIAREKALRATAASLLALPLRRQQAALVAGLLPLVVWPGLCALAGSTLWLGLDRLRSVLLVCLLSAAFSAILMFYRTRRSLAPTRSALAERSDGAAVFAKLLGEGSCAARVPLLVVLPAIAAAWLVMDATAHVQRARAEEQALDWLAAVVTTRASATGPLMQDSVLAADGRAPSQWPMAAEVFVFTPGSEAGPDPLDSSPAFRAALEREVEAVVESGLIAPQGGPHIGAFRRGADGNVWVVRADRRTLATGSGLLPFGVSIIVALLAGVAGALVSREFTRSARWLLAEAQRLAAGHLEPIGFDPTDDEFGRIALSLRAVGESFRETLEGSAQAASRVEAHVSRLSTALEGIAGASADQNATIDRANQLMRSVHSQVEEASRSAAQLTSAMDASGESVEQLGATGAELNETASLLTSKVDAMSDSLEQMVESVRQVGSTTGRLAEASEETSSSMEEMASAMRAVDTSAETTAKLSRDVVERAELGQAKVVQTIAGMEEIREATEAAERVIRGLGARTSEIGGILDVIEDVADETNLLALNAAIIAAQAGEQGKAFSVVAEEIKELADRVLASTKEIASLIGAVQLESENAIGAIEAGSNSVMGGVDLAAEAGRTLEEITEASRESGTRIGEIVSSVREQTRAASHVVALMERVRDSADQIGVASAEQDRGNDVVYRSAQTMREVAEQVRRTTEAQSTGFGRILANVSDARAAAGQITGALAEQSGACTQVAGFLASVAAGSRSNEDSAEEVRAAMAGLAAEAARLRAEAERFRC